jgi:ribosomal protein L16 Arg81 hydroxylase
MALYDPTEADEKRDERLIELTREAVDALTQALAAGLPKTMALIDEALGEYLQDDQARAELLRKTAAGGSPLTKILSDLIWTEAGVRAEQELQRLDRDGAEEADDARIDLMLWHRETA